MNYLPCRLEGFFCPLKERKKREIKRTGGQAKPCFLNFHPGDPRSISSLWWLVTLLPPGCLLLVVSGHTPCPWDVSCWWWWSHSLPLGCLLLVESGHTPCPWDVSSSV